jgi:hypothetical protein
MNLLHSTICEIIVKPAASYGLGAIVKALTDLFFGRPQRGANCGRVAQIISVAADVSRLKFSAKEE